MGSASAAGRPSFLAFGMPMRAIFSGPGEPCCGARRPNAGNAGDRAVGTIRGNLKVPGLYRSIIKINIVDFNNQD